MHHFLGAPWSCFKASHVYFMQSVYLIAFIVAKAAQYISPQLLPAPRSIPENKYTHLVCFGFSSLMQMISDLSYSLVRADFLHLVRSVPIIWCVTSDNRSPSAGKPEKEILLWQRVCVLATLPISCAPPVCHQVVHASCMLPYTWSLLPS